MSGVFLYLLLTSLLLHSSSADTLFQSCGGGNYTSNSTYHSNLNHLLTFFTSLNSATFSNHTQGSDPDTAYGLFLCRGDVSLSDCRICVQNAVQDALSLCPGSKQATLWYDNCELRYSNLRFFGTAEDSNSPILINVQNYTKQADNFIRLQRDLLDKVTEHAAYNSSLMFATGAAANGSYMKVNGLAQCTRDLSMDSCSQCLQQIRAEYTGYEVRVGGRVLGKSCNFRYEVYPFYQGNPTVLINLAAPSPPPSSSPFAVSPPLPSIKTDLRKEKKERKK